MTARAAPGTTLPWPYVAANALLVLTRGLVHHLSR